MLGLKVYSHREPVNVNLRIYTISNVPEVWQPQPCEFCCSCRFKLLIFPYNNLLLFNQKCTHTHTHLLSPC